MAFVPRNPSKKIIQAWTRMWERALFFAGAQSGVSILNSEVTPPDCPKFNLKFLFSSSSGLFLYDNGKLIHLIDGFIFGVTAFDGKLFCTQECYLDEARSVYRMTRILALRLVGDRVTDLSIVRSGLPRGAHQIAADETHFYFLDSSSNVVLKFLHSNIVGWNKQSSVSLYYDRNAEEKGQHLNSVALNAELLYLLAHNDFHATGRNSRWYLIDKQGNLLREVGTDARCAHDIIPSDDEVIICNSEEGVVQRGDEVLFRSPENLFVRGFAMVGDYVLVGASERVERARRELTRATIYFLNREYNLLDTLRIDQLPNGKMGGNVKVIAPYPNSLG